VAARPTAAGAEREIKFTLSAGRAHVARDWLDRLCRRDPKYPAAIVWTIYYDTPALVSLGEKINSDYLKRKIRVRWYSDLGGRVAGPAFVEAKLRVGTNRSKERKVLPFQASDIATWELGDPRLLTLPRMLNPAGVVGVEPWHPIMLIRYRRDRFVESLSRARVSLDSEIAATAIHPRLVSTLDRTPLGSAVLEVKGQSDTLPAPLQPMLALGIRKASFSKLLAVYAHVTHQIT
jgi:hypothetical protein